VPAGFDSGELVLGERVSEQPRSDHGRLWRFRTAVPVAPALPAPWGNPDDPLVYVSYGSVTARQSQFAPLYAATAGVLADQPIRVLMTTGHGYEVSAGALPPIVRWSNGGPGVGERASAVVGHGGFGTTMRLSPAAYPKSYCRSAFDQTVHARKWWTSTQGSNCRAA
jgi:UDP:flavonoid glycosyltransferase YjiC (YdhE family)